ncbi:MAG: hypothetical protein GXY55_16390 [Phycisphaerae bacterium]|nr:hypothetical protein [Phycisphaerae bacterium]
MDGTTTNILSVGIPREDPAVATALADVEARLAAYADAMREAHAKLAQQSRDGEVEVPSDSVEPLADACGSESAPQSRDRAEAVPQSEEHLADERGSDVMTQTESAPQSRDREEAVPQSEEHLAEEHGSDVMTQADLEPADSEPAEADSEPPQAEDDDDETLLASLDPETAQAIRVMRRLTPERKSVRQLLAEYQTSKAEEVPARAEKKRSWFLRGR